MLQAHPVLAGRPGCAAPPGLAASPGLRASAARAGHEGRRGHAALPALRGATGPSSLTGMLVTLSMVTSGDNTALSCPVANPIVIGGGYSGVDGTSASGSFPSASNAWQVTLNAIDPSWTIYAICST